MQINEPEFVGKVSQNIAPDSGRWCVHHIMFLKSLSEIY